MQWFDAFKRIWANNGTTSDISGNNWDAGWGFIGSLPPKRVQFNELQQITDKKLEWLYAQLEAAATDKGLTLTELDTDTLKSLFRGLVVQVPDLYTLANSPWLQIDGLQVQVASFYTGDLVGGGVFVYKGSSDKTEHNGFTVISPSVPFDGTVGTTLAFLSGTGETQPTGKGVWCRIWEGEVILTWAGGKESPAPGQNPNAFDNTPVLNHIVDYFQIVDPWVYSASVVVGQPISILIPSGEWNFNGTTRIGVDDGLDYISKIVIRGAGRSATTLRSYDNSKKMFEFNNSQPNLREVELKDLRIVWGAGIYLEWFRYSQINNVEFSQTRGTGGGVNDFAVYAESAPSFVSLTEVNGCWFYGSSVDCVYTKSATLVFNSCLFGENNGAFIHSDTGELTLRDCRIFGSRPKTFTGVGEGNDGVCHPLFYVSGTRSRITLIDCAIDADTNGTNPDVLLYGSGAQKFTVQGLNLTVPPTGTFTLLRDGNAQLWDYPPQHVCNVTIKGLGNVTLVDNYNSRALIARRTRNSMFSNISMPAGSLCDSELLEPHTNNTFENIHFT